MTSKSLNRNTIRGLILRNWNTREKVVINEVGDKLLLFNFKRSDDLNRVIRDAPGQ